MRRIALGLAIAVVVCLVGRAHAADIYDCYNGSAERGGNRITTNGIQSLQYVQQSFPGAQVDVYVHNTTNHATIWQDGAGTVPLANPFSASSAGVAFVCAADGRYDFKYSLGGITTPFTVSDIKFCFSCAGGGGGSTINPGTPNQVVKYDATGANITNSSGGIDDGINPVPWVNGLSVNNSGYNKQRPNGTNCTTSNLLVEYDGNVVNGLASVQTAAISSQNAIGVAIQGAGCTGSVQITDHGFGACVFDNQTVIHDLVVASGTTAGYCSDAGTATTQRALGRVASFNTGTGTQAIVDWFTGDTQGVSGTVTSCATGGGANAYYPGIGQIISCDPFIKDDGNGGLTFNNPAYAGFSWKKQGPLPPATPANTRMDTMPTSVTTHTVIHPGTSGGVGKAEVVASTSTDANGNTIDTMAWGTAGGDAQLNGTDLANCVSGSCPLINFLNSAISPAGMGLTWTNPSGGQIQPVLNDGTIHALNPGLPTAVVNGTPASTDYKYAIVGCEDINCTYHSAISSVVDVPTGAATITSVNSITLSAYADTLYGYRFYKVCRTASSGTPASTGVIATGAGKSFIDTGLTADGSNCASLYASNTTVLSPIPCLSSFSPGGPSMPGAPCGIDAPPLSPHAIDDEFSEQFGAPGDANNPFWIQVNPGTATYTWTGGAISIAGTGASADSLHCIFHAIPATPFGIVASAYYNTTRTGNVQAILALRESATGKMVSISAQIQTGGGSSEFVYARWTNATTNSVYTPSTVAMTNSQPIYLKVGYDGTNTEYEYSLDGLVYQVSTTEAKNAFFTTAPDQVGVCNDAFAGTSNVDFDYFRQVAF